jgi:hypothetical protein
MTYQIDIVLTKKSQMRVHNVQLKRQAIHKKIREQQLAQLFA